MFILLFILFFYPYKNVILNEVNQRSTPAGAKVKNLT